MSPVRNDLAFGDNLWTEAEVRLVPLRGRGVGGRFVDREGRAGRAGAGRRPAAAGLVTRGSRHPDTNSLNSTRTDGGRRLLRLRRCRLRARPHPQLRPGGRSRPGAARRGLRRHSRHPATDDGGRDLADHSGFPRRAKRLQPTLDAGSHRCGCGAAAAGADRRFRRRRGTRRHRTLRLRKCHRPRRHTQKDASAGIVDADLARAHPRPREP